MPTSTDSPNFRPAARQLEQTEEENNSKDENGSQEIDGERKRKSLGRRVSFAPTAKVRFIDPDRENKNSVNSPSSLLNNADNIGKKVPEATLLNSPGFAKPITNSNIPGSPSFAVRQQELDDVFSVLPRSPKSFQNSQSKSCSNLENSKMTTGSPSKGSNSVQQEGGSDMSIEVDVRDPQSSFSSFNESDAYFPGGSSNTVNSVPSPLRHFTTAYGGNPPNAFSDQDDNAMEMTFCVGGLLTNQPRVIDSQNDSIDVSQYMGAGNDVFNTFGNQPSISDPLHNQETKSNTEAKSTSNHSHGSVSETINGTPKMKAVWDSPCSVDTMELTRCVGGIVNNRRLSFAGSTPSHLGSRSHSQLSMRSSPKNMEMTETVGKILITDSVLQVQLRNEIQHSSPFSMSRIHDMRLESELSFIGDTGAPDVMAHFASEEETEFCDTAASGTHNDGQTISTVEFCNQPVNSQDLSQLPHVHLDEELYHPQTRSNRGIFSHETSFIENYSTNGASISANKALELTPIKVLDGDAAFKFADEPPLTESPTVTIMLPRASLRVFLQETGVRFMDQLSTTTRRETLGRPRDSVGSFTLVKRLQATGAASVECEVYESACHDLETQIESTRKNLETTEEHFNHSPPLAFLEWHRNIEQRPETCSKLKILKGVARMFAKAEWYQWRQNHHANLNKLLSRNLALSKENMVKYEKESAKTRDDVIKLHEDVEALRLKLAETQRRHARLVGDDWERAESLEIMASAQDAILAKNQTDLNELYEIEKETRLKKAQAETLRQSNRQQIEVYEERVRVKSLSCAAASPQRLGELRANLALLQAVCGWSLLGMSTECLSVQHARTGTRVSLILSNHEQHPDSGSVDGLKKCKDLMDEWTPKRKRVKDTPIMIKIDHSSVRSTLVQHASRLLGSKAPPGMDLFQTLIYVGQTIDFLWHLDHQLSLCSMQCVASIPHVNSLNNSSRALPLSLGFLHQGTRAKFDLLLSVSLSPEPAIEYSQVVPLCDPVPVKDISEAVCLVIGSVKSCMTSCIMIKRIVGAVTNVLDTRV